MKKLFIIMFVVLFAATAYAVDFQTSGSYYARGTWISNENGLQTGNEANLITGRAADPTVDYGFYDHELDMTTRIVVDDNTYIHVNYEIHDEQWVSSGANNSHTGELDDNIQFKRVFGSYTWAQTGTNLQLGLMTGGVWASDFASSGTEKYRIRGQQATSFGPIIAILEKNAELGQTNGDLDDSEKDDSDAYYLAWVGKLGPVSVLPLLGYSYNSSANQEQNSDGIQTFVIDLGIEGAYDGWGFESEFRYNNVSVDDAVTAMDPTLRDADLWGAYARLWAQFGAANVYGLIAYGNEDEGQAFAMGDDFEPQLLFGNQYDFGPVGSQISGSTYAVIGVNYAATEALSFNANFGYVSSNIDADPSYRAAVNFWDGADAFEFDLGFAYKISDAVKYSAAFGWADIDLGDEADRLYGDPDDSWRLYHRFDIAF